MYNYIILYIIITYKYHSNMYIMVTRIHPGIECELTQCCYSVYV